MASRKRTRIEGFTVVELIVAMSISAVTLLSGYELFEAIKNASDREDADMAVMADVARCLHTMREDLLHAMPRAESEEPIFAGGNPPSGSQSDTAALLEFYALCPGGAEGTARCVRQMYQIRYELSSGAEGLVLYRSAIPVVAAELSSGGSARRQIFGGLEGVDVSFQNGHRVVPSFSSSEAIPIGVEVTITTGGRAWPLAVRLPCGSPEAQE